jgi:GxxExxY protein
MISMINEQNKYSELTSRIIGCAMTVHKALGNGFQEVIYQRALEIEMQLADIAFSREFEMPIFQSLINHPNQKNHSSDN